MEVEEVIGEAPLDVVQVESAPEFDFSALDDGQQMEEVLCETQVQFFLSVQC